MCVLLPWGFGAHLRYRGNQDGNWARLQEPPSSSFMREHIANMHKIAQIMTCRCGMSVVQRRRECVKNARDDLKAIKTLGHSKGEARTIHLRCDSHP